jgi:DNA-directed RNA polymerase specialized sigma24 family protein
MSEENIELAKFKSWAMKRFYLVSSSDIEDLVAYCSHQWAQGKRLTSSYLQIATDYFRKHGKKIQGKRGSQDALAAYGNLLIDQREDVEWDSIDLKGMSNGRADIEIPEFILKPLKNIERAMIVLFYYWGLTQKEIAYIFGVSESRVCQRMKNSHEQMKKYLGKDYGKPS